MRSVECVSGRYAVGFQSYPYNNREIAAKFPKLMRRLPDLLKANNAEREHRTGGQKSRALHLKRLSSYMLGVLPSVGYCEWRAQGDLRVVRTTAQEAGQGHKNKRSV